MTSPILEMRRIHKRFPGVHALRDVSFAVRKGTVHGIVGENGARYRQFSRATVQPKRRLWLMRFGTEGSTFLVSGATYRMRRFARRLLSEGKK
jgi:hypothetical protein